MLTYDVHQHLWPAPFVEALRARVVAPCLEGSVLTTPEGSFEIDLGSHDLTRRHGLMDANGIDVAVVSLQPSLGIEALAPVERAALERVWRDGIGDVVAASGGRLRALAPWSIAPGFAGTSVGASAFAGEHGADVLEAVDAVGGVLFVHPEAEELLPAGRPAWWQWTAGYTGQMQRAYLAWLGGLRERYPRIRVIFAMLAGGAPIHHERLIHRGVDVRSSLDPDTLFDTASYGRRAIELCIETFGVEQLVYGSDVPVIDPAATLASVRGMGESVARLLQSDTPERLFAQPIDEDRRPEET